MGETKPNRDEERAAERLRFEVSQSIRLKDEEIERLKKKLEEFKNQARSPLRARYEELKQQLAERKPTPTGSDVGSEQSSVTESDDRAELKRIDEESEAARARIEQLRKLIEKMKGRQLPSIGTSSLLVASGDDGRLRAKDDRKLQEIEQQIAEEKARTRKLRESLVRVKNASLTDFSPWLESERTDWTVEVARILAEGSELEKRQYLGRLTAENIQVKAEIGRIDSVLYGRAGRYRDWRVKHVHRSPSAGAYSYFL